MEGGLIAKSAPEIDFVPLDFRGVRGKGLFGAVTGVIKLFKATAKSKQLMRDLKPDVFFTTGGYIAVPVNNGAKKNHVRTVIMNCDADLLMSTEMILRDAWAVACGFAGSARSRAASKGYITGKGYIVNTAPYVTVVGGVNMDIGGWPGEVPVMRDSNPGGTKRSSETVGLRR